MPRRPQGQPMPVAANACSVSSSIVSLSCPARLFWPVPAVSEPFSCLVDGPPKVGQVTPAPDFRRPQILAAADNGLISDQSGCSDGFRRYYASNGGQSALPADPATVWSVHAALVRRGCAPQRTRDG